MKKAEIETAFPCIPDIKKVREERRDFFIRGSTCLILRTFSKARRRRQRGRGKTNGLISRAIAQQVRFKTVYISSPSAK